MNLPKLTIGIAAIYLIPAFFVGVHIEDIKSLMQPDKKNMRIAYASTLPNVMTMTTEQHLAFLKQEYASCESGTNYLKAIEVQHQNMPLSSALEVATMVESICSQRQP